MFESKWKNRKEIHDFYNNKINKLSSRVKKLSETIKRINKYKKIENFNETNGDFCNVFIGGLINSKKGLYIRLYKKKRTYQLIYQLSFTDKEEAQMIKDNYGGNIKEYIRNNHKNIFIWELKGANNTLNFIRLIEKYIINKNLKKRFKIAKEFASYQLKHFSEKKNSDKKKVEGKYYKRMKKLI